MRRGRPAFAGNVPWRGGSAPSVPGPAASTLFGFRVCSMLLLSCCLQVIRHTVSKFELARQQSVRTPHAGSLASQR